MKKKQTILLSVILAVLVTAGVTVFAVSNYGSEEDPLITKSYLDEVLRPQLEAELKKELEDAADRMRSSTPGEFTELELSAGQTLKCSAGCELLLRSGTAQAVGESSPALLDTTDGGSLFAGGEVPSFHLCVAAEEGCGLIAGSGGCVVLVSGGYTAE